MESPWTSGASSILDAVASDPAGRRLRIRFGTGAIYDNNVPPVVWDEMRVAPSKGAHFSGYVRPDYPYRRVQAAERTRAAPVMAGR